MTNPIRIPALALLAAAPALAQCPVQLADLTAPASVDDAEYGAAVDLEGDTAMVGAPNDTITAFDEGTVAVFTFDGNAWNQTQTLTPNDPGDFDRFGVSIDIKGDVAVIGSPFKTEGQTFAGAAYVFVRNAGTWVQVQKLTADDSAPEDRFGAAVAMNEGCILVGAPRDDNDNGVDAGAVYVFEYNGQQWVQTDKILSDLPEPGAVFGKAIAADAGRAIVGASAVGPNGYATILEFDGGAWVQTDTLEHAGSVLDRGVDLDGADAIVATQFEVVIWHEDGGWARQHELAAPGINLAVAIGPDAAAIGNPDADTYATDRGKGLLYRREGVSWSYDSDVLPYADLPAGQRIASALAIDAGRVLTGAKGGGTVPGGAYLFEDAGGDCPTFQVPGDFAAIRPAVLSAIDGVTIEIADGVYTGPDNTNIDPSGRDVTVRSANGPDACVIDAQNQTRAILINTFPHAAGGTPIFEGITVRNGRATGNGGAVRVLPGPDTPTFVNCRFEDCHANNRGGAIDVREGTAMLVGCTIAGATADNRGGAVHVKDGGFLAMLDTTIESSGADTIAGGAYVDAGFLHADRCVIRDCVADASGAGLFVANGGQILVTNSLLENNAAMNDGGALAASSGGFIEATGCTLVGNTAGRGSVLFALDDATEVGLWNSVLWDNPAGDDSQAFLALGAAATVDRCDVEGGLDAVTLFDGDSSVDWLTNMDADPLFTDAGAGDYTLAAGSPCIDAGDNTAVPEDDLDSDGDGDVAEPTPLDLAGLPRFVDDPATDDTGFGDPPLVDIGAHEFQADACYADCNGDGQLSILDYVCFQQLFQAGDLGADCNGDGQLSILDFVCFQTAFGQGCN